LIRTDVGVTVTTVFVGSPTIVIVVAPVDAAKFASAEIKLAVTGFVPIMK
jgi:hypothetical protein